VNSTNKHLSQLTGKLLGDGCITKQIDRKPRFQFMHRSEDLAWSQHCYEELKNFLPLNPPRYQKVLDPRMRADFSERYVVQSKTNEVITELERVWYNQRKKTLPLDFIRQYLNEEALAWWYQDDGHLKKQNHCPQKIVLSTDNFTEQENTFLKQILLEKFQLSLKMDSQNRLLLYDQSQIYYFLKLIQPYTHPCMGRKMIHSQSIQEIPIKAKRTTIYLPDSILLRKPTEEINHVLSYTNFILTQLEDRGTFLKLYQSTKQIFLTEYEYKSYQVTISPNNRAQLYKIKQLTGWKYSQITLLCFHYRDSFVSVP